MFNYRLSLCAIVLSLMLFPNAKEIDVDFARESEIKIERTLVLDI